MYIELFRDKEHDTHDLSSNYSEKKICATCVSVCVCMDIEREQTEQMEWKVNSGCI